MIQSRRSQSVAHTHTSRMMVLVLLLWIGASSSSSVLAVLSATADSTLSPPELPRHHLLNPNNAQQQQPASTLHFVSSPPASQSSQSIPSTTHSRRSRFPRAETITGAAQSTNSSSSVIITNALRMAFFYSTDITDLGYSYQINTARRAALRTMRLQYPNISIQHFVYPGMVAKGKAATRAAVYEALDVHQVHVVVACSVDIYLAWPDTTSMFAMVQSYPHVRFLDLNLNRLLTQGWPANFAAQGFAIQGALFLAGAVAGSSCVDAVGLLMPAASSKSSASAFYKGMLFGQRYNSRYATMNINHTYDNHTICRLYAINQNTFSAPSSEIQLSKLFIGLKCSVIFFWCDTRTAPLWIKEANVSVQSITWAADGTLVVGDSVLSGIVLYPYNAFQNVTRDVITGKPLNQSYYLWRIGVDAFLGRVSALAPRNATLAKEAALRLIYERQGGVFCEDFYNSSGHLVWSPAQAGVPCMSQADMSLRYNVFSPGITVLPDYIHSKGLCAPGYFVARDPNTFLPHCELCPEGSISTSTGTDVCTPCRSPMVSDSNHTLCIHLVVVPTDHSVLIVLIVSSLIAFALVVALIAYLRGVWVHDGDWAWPFRVHHDEAAVTGELLHRVVEAPEGPMIALALLAIDPGLGDRSWRQQLSVMSDIYQMLFDAVKTVSVELHVYVALNVGDVFLLAHQSAETLAIAVRRIDALFMEYSQNNSHHAAMVASYGLALRCVVHYCEPTVVSNQRTTTGNNNNRAKKKVQLSQNNISSSSSPAASSSQSPPKWSPNAAVPPPPASSNDEASGADDTASIAESRASSTRRRKRSSRVEYSGPCVQFVKKLWGSEQIFPQIAWKGWGGSGGGERDLDVVSNESSPTPSLTRAALRHQRLASKPAVVIGVPSALAEQAAINVPSQQQRPASRFVITQAALNEVTHSLKCEPHGLVPEFDSEILAEQQQQQQQQPQPSLSQENVKDSLQVRNQGTTAVIAGGRPQEGVVATTTTNTTTLSSCIPRSFAVAIVNHDNRQLTVALPPHLMPPPHVPTKMLPLSPPTTITPNPLPLPQTPKIIEKVGPQPAASSPKNSSSSNEKGAALVVEDQQHSSKVEKGEDDDESDARAPLPLPTSDEEEAVMEQHAAEAMVMHSNNTNINDPEVLTPVAPSIPPNNNSNNNNNHENHTVMELFDLLVVLDALSSTKDAPLGAGIGGGGGGDHHGRGGSSVGGDHAAGLSSWREGFGITSSDAAPRIPLALCPMPSLPNGEGKFAGGELPSFRNDAVSPKSGLVDAQGASNGPSQSHRGGAVHLPSSSSSLTIGGGRGAGGGGGGGVGSPPTVLDAAEHRGLRLAPASAPPPQRVVQQQQQQFHPITGVSGDPQHVTSSSDPASHHNQSSLFPSNSSFSSLLASDQGTVVNATGGGVVSPGIEQQQQQGTRRRTTAPTEDSFMDWSDTDRSDHPIGLMPSNYTTTTATTITTRTMNKNHQAGVSPRRQAERGGARGERRQREIMSLFGNARATMLTESQLLTVTRITYGILNRFLLLACQLQSSEIEFNDEKSNQQQQVDNEENDDGDSDLDDTRRPRSSIRTRSNSSGSSAASARQQKRKDATKKENAHLISRVDLIMMAAARLRIELPVSVVMPMLYGGSDSLWGDGEHGAAQFQRRQQQKALRRSLSNSGSGGSSGGDDEETSVPSASGFSRRVTMILENDRRRTAVPMQMQGVSERKRWQEKLTSLHLVKQYRAEVQHVTKGTLKRVAAQVVLTMDELLLVEWLRTAGLAHEQQTLS